MDIASDVLDTPYKAGPDVQSSTSFPDPFLDMASFVMPRSLRNVLDMCEGIWLKNGTYRMALSRIARYFITKIEFEGVDLAQGDKFKKFMNDKLRVIDNLALIGDDFLAYGNSFTSVILPFRRYLVCSKAKLMSPISKLDWEFKDWKFYAYCRACKSKHEHTHLDIRSDVVDDICIKRWAPQELKLQAHPVAQAQSRYYWAIPANIRQEITRGNRFIIEYMPWEIIETVKQSKLFKFAPGVVYHMKEQALAGINLNGWGVSRLLSSFAQAWYVQILKRANETFALDYTVPFRILTPAATPGRDPLQMHLGEFTSRILTMLRDHRRDPAQWHALPFPVTYQVIGAENKSLATPELISNGLTELLNSLGIPAELYQATLQFQAWPAALRLFQQTWPHLVSNFNGWLAWVADIICTEMNWDTPTKIALQPVTLADDIEHKQLLMNLASANIVSKRTAFAPYGIDLNEEIDQIIREQKYAETKFREYQEDTAQKEQLRQGLATAMAMNINPATMAQPQGQPVTQAAAYGATSPVTGPTGEMTPEDKLNQARDMAIQLLQMPYEVRKTEMTKLKHADVIMHALVKSKMEEVRAEAEASGRQALQRR